MKKKIWFFVAILFIGGAMLHGSCKNKNKEKPFDPRADSIQFVNLTDV